MPSVEPLPGRLIAAAALVSEGALAAIAVLWRYLGGSLPPLSFELRLVLWGGAAAVMLALVNYLVLRVWAAPGSRGPLRRFMDEVIVPVCGGLNLREAAIVAAASGLGEELFFRGAVNEALMHYLSLPAAVALGSFIFAYVHFLGKAREYALLVMWYTLFGVFFSLLTLRCGDLTAAVVCHGLYNFMAMTYIRRREATRPSGQTES